MGHKKDQGRTREAAAGKWRGILPLVAKIDAKVLDGKHHPCPGKSGRDAGKDRFRFADRNGTGNYFCDCSDGNKGGIALVMCCRSMDYATAATAIDEVVGKIKAEPVKPPRDPRPALQRMQRAILPASQRGHVHEYLAGRGLTLPPTLHQARIPYWVNGESVGDYDVMAAKIVGPDGKPLSWHLTYLSNGKKLDLVVRDEQQPARKIMTAIPPPPGSNRKSSLPGAAVRLAPAAVEMGIGEGLESSLAAMELFKVPVWSALNEGLLEDWEPPDVVRNLYIFGDNDRNFVGQASAYALAKKLARRRPEIKSVVVFPNRDGQDWNDVLQESQRARG